MVAGERVPFLGAQRPHGRASAIVAGTTLAAATALLVLTLVAAHGPSSLLSVGQMLVVGEAYPYVRTPYSDVARPYGYQAPAQYPVYPYESGYSYSNVQPYYEQYHKAEGKANHEWFPDDYNVGTGPLSPLWTAMAGKQWKPQQAELRQSMGPGMDQAMTTSLERLDDNYQERAPTQAVSGGQYYSPILPTENEYAPWSIFGDNWADHTYEPSVNPQARRNRQSQLRAAAVSEARLGDNNGFQQLAHADWHTKGFSNNYMGMQAPVRNVNPLGDHQVGFTDREYSAVNASVDPEEQNHVVDNALRSMWDVFSGNEDITKWEAPKMGYSLDNAILCDEEDDPALCSPRPYGARPVSNERTNPQWIPYPTNVKMNQGVLAADAHGPNRGVLPAGGGLRTYHGRRGDLIKDCTDPSMCHLKAGASSTGPVLPVVPPYGLSRIPDGHNVGVDFQPLFTRPPAKPLDEWKGMGEPEWLHDLRNASGYAGP